MQRPVSLHLLIAILLTTVCLGLLWIGERFNRAHDVTANHRHSLSSTTQSVLASLDTPVNITAVIGPSPEQRRGIEALVASFQSIKPDITLQFINPETQPALARSYDPAPGGELILQAGEREQRLQTLSERSLAGSLQRLMREGTRDIVFITGHEERSPIRPGNDDWQVVAQRLAAIGLVSREQSLISEPWLSDDVDLLVIADPRLPYFPGEIASISDYLDRGGNLLWLSELSSDKSTGPGLRFLGDNLGIDMLPGTVIDTASQSLAAGAADFVLLDRFPVHPVTRSLSSPILLPQATALAVTPLAGQEEQALLQTPASSWTESGELTGAIGFDDNTTEIAGPLLLGVTIERTTAQGIQRFAVIGDADFAASQFVGNGANQSFTEALVLWLTGDADALDFITQRAPDSELTLNTRSIIGLSALYLAAVPLALLLTGLLVRWRRRRA